MPETGPLAATHLPEGVRSRMIDTPAPLRMHLLEAGDPGRPCLLLLHGFPELAYSWRRIMPALAAAGFHVIAPDQRGYGRTTGWDGRFAADLAPWRMLNLVRDALALLAALGRSRVAAVVGHDFGAPVAGWCALARPDIFPAVAMMSAPFAGPPSWQSAPAPDPVHADLAALPRPRKHYQWYYSTAAAEADMLACPQGLHAFLRAYYHMKSADWMKGSDWAASTPAPLAGWTAAELARMPEYYIMDQASGMAATVAPHMPSPAQIAGCAWLPDAELAVYSTEFARTGLQGGLNWYRCNTNGDNAGELRLFAGRRIDVPALFIAGRQDWGAQQVPGSLERMRHIACADMRGCHFVDGAGHWVQQEQPAATAALLLDFLRGLAA
ncbi:MAG: alpha/beta fold hydrolase [Rhodospirillales bacterium]|nr:alpha/beta fold hydrolase [Rhodospirillales bacterium]